MASASGGNSENGGEIMKHCLCPVVSRVYCPNYVNKKDGKLRICERKENPNES